MSSYKPGDLFKVDLDELFYINGSDRELYPVAGMQRYLGDDAEGAFCLMIGCDDATCDRGTLVAYGLDVCELECWDPNGNALCRSIAVSKENGGDKNVEFLLTSEELARCAKKA